MLDLKNYKDIRSKTVWTTKDGDAYPVKRMETSHVQNTIILLTRKLEECKKLSLGDYIIKEVKAE